MQGATPFSRALDRRRDLIASLADTDCYRLLHGIAEGAPGLAIDRYGPILLVQTWREPIEDLDAIARIAEPLGDLTVVWNHRGKPKGTSFADFHDPEIPGAPECVEHGLRFDARPRHRGIDPLLFLDFRVARRTVRQRARGHVLNTFAYTGGISVAAMAGGAESATNLDFASSALVIAEANAERNGVTVQTLQSDYFPAIRQFAGLDVGGRRGKRPRFTKLEPRQFDLVVLDPPRWAKTPWGAVDVVRDYPSLLKPALLTVAEGGALLATNNHAKVPLDEWLAVVRRTAERVRPIRDLDVLTPDADFPSFDANPPLKLAWIQL